MATRPKSYYRRLGLDESAQRVGSTDLITVLYSQLGLRKGLTQAFLFPVTSPAPQRHLASSLGLSWGSVSRSGFLSLPRGSLTGFSSLSLLWSSVFLCHYL